MDGWHFSEGRMAHGRKTTLEAGRTYRIRGEPVLCERGLHASERLIDALQNGSGPILSRVHLGGTIIAGADKLVATERTHLWMVDCTRELHEFAADAAEWALDRVEARGVTVAPPSRAAVSAKRAWLAGEIDDARLAAAWAAAGANRWAASRNAAWAAAWAAAWDPNPSAAAWDELDAMLQARLSPLFPEPGSETRA